MPGASGAFSGNTRRGTSLLGETWGLPLEGKKVSSWEYLRNICSRILRSEVSIATVVGAEGSSHGELLWVWRQ